MSQPDLFETQTEKGKWLRVLSECEVRKEASGSWHQIIHAPSGEVVPGAPKYVSHEAAPHPALQNIRYRPIRFPSQKEAAASLAELIDTVRTAPEVVE